MFPLSTPFLLTKPGERMIMYARDMMFPLSTPFLEISMFPLSTPFLLTKPGERMIMYLCARDIDVSSFYTFSIDQARRENDHVFVF